MFGEKVKNIALFLSHKPGYEVALFFINRKINERIVSIYLTDDIEPINCSIIELFKNSETRIFVGKDVIHSKDHLDWFKSNNIEALISVYWPWLFRKELLSNVDLTINFHPALLPINRGWYPHVHNIIEGTKAGVTLHEISEKADTGDIWIQKEVSIKNTDTAKTLYDRLQIEIVNLFTKNWEKISSKEIPKSIQDENLANYHRKTDVLEFDLIDIEKTYKGSELINILRARSFGSKGFAYYLINNEKVYLNLRLSDTSNFE